jgi:phosphoribosyl 1,2-cyclic phosphate phosphodiesterase
MVAAGPVEVRPSVSNRLPNMKASRNRQSGGGRRGSAERLCDRIVLAVVQHACQKAITIHRHSDRSEATARFPKPTLPFATLAHPNHSPPPALYTRTRPRAFPDEQDFAPRSMLTLTFLGTGTSNGVPMIGCDCEICTSTDARDNRNRTAAYLVWGNTHLLIDTATEFRLQALKFGIREVDAVLFTHAHADHTGGFDELRRFNELAQAHLPVYAGPDTAAILRERFAYAFEDVFPFYGGKPDLILHEVRGPFEIAGKTIVPIPVTHGRTNVLGYRFGPVAYVTDAKLVPESSMDLLQGVDTLIINALRERPHPTHLSFSEAVELIERIAPRRAYLVHLSHETSHVAASALLPDGIEVAYDGLTITVD